MGARGGGGARQRPRGEVGKPQARQEEGGPHPGTSLAVKWGARGAALPSSRGTGKRFGQKRGRTARWDRDFSLLFSQARFHGVALTCPRHTGDVRRPVLPAAPARGASDPVLTGTGRADAHFPPRARARLASSLGSPAASCLTAPAGPAQQSPAAQTGSGAVSAADESVFIQQGLEAGAGVPSEDGVVTSQPLRPHVRRRRTELGFRVEPAFTAPQSSKDPRQTLRVADTAEQRCARAAGRGWRVRVAGADREQSPAPASWSLPRARGPAEQGPRSCHSLGRTGRGTAGRGEEGGRARSSRRKCPFLGALPPSAAT